MYKFLLSIAFVTGLSAEIVGGVAIVVKDRAITLHDIQSEMSSSNVNKEMATNALVRQKLEEAEIQERKIKVTSGEVYDDIKQTAKRNNMSVNDFYEAALKTRGIGSADVKKKVKQKLLATKLYQAIAYSKVSEPTDTQVKEYFELHKSNFEHPSSFDVVIYQSNNKDALEAKVQNPMFYSPEIKSTEQTLPYDRISPELAGLLTRTPINNFSPIIPDGKGGYMSFYLKEVQSSAEAGFEAMKEQVINAWMAEKREAVLSDYFARLKDNADIQVLRNLD